MSVTKLYKEMRLDDYLSLIHVNDRDTILKVAQQKILNGEIKTDKDLEEFTTQDLRCNTTEPEIGKLSPIRKIINDDPEIIGHTKIPTLQISIEKVRIIE
jgi:hypothetical protein